MPTLVTRDAPRSPALRSRTVRSIADRMLTILGRADHELSVLLTSDAFIHELNRAHRNKDSATDVLAFPQQAEDAEDTTTQPPASLEPDGAAAGELLGDVVISLDTAAKQAQTRGHALLEEVRFLLAHGILHLVGYDHQTDAEETEMNRLTRHLVSTSKTNARHPST